ncbi:MAG TPA: VIT1/CCC1 transporter family protein [Candidatus Dormibacteraeota bacterium]|nr:VIT1/CCC1 transporter family protein [Candidatus Dormibacteraeota bacterium]
MNQVSPAQGPASPSEIATSLANLKLEQDAIVLYDRLAGLERDPRRAAAFRTIAGNERRHAEIWATRLRGAGAQVPPAGRPRARIRFILAVARLFGTRSVAELVRSLEGDEEALYLDQGSEDVASIVADEREHAEIWRRLDDRTGAEADGTGAEAWHRSGQSGTLRASIFGVSDGLVSNLSLVMGFVGAAAANQLVVLAGVAGLLAGAFSMAAGEWISMTSQRELFERQIELEREELKVMPEQEELELAAVYRRKGIPDADARRLAHRLMADPEVALDTKAREELGLDPDQLGSPWGAAISSFLAFTVGAFVPLAAFLVTSGRAAFLAALVLSGVALFVVGAAVSLFTGRSFVYSGTRQVLIGAAAAAVTYGVGAVIGVAIAG